MHALTHHHHVGVLADPGEIVVHPQPDELVEQLLGHQACRQEGGRACGRGLLVW